MTTPETARPRRYVATLTPLRAAYEYYSAETNLPSRLDALSDTFIQSQENPTMLRAFLREVVADVAVDYTVNTRSDVVRERKPDKPVEAFCAFSRLTEEGMNFKPNEYDVYYVLSQWNRSQLTSFDPNETGILVKAVAERWFEDGENSFSDALLSHMNPPTEEGLLSLFILPNTTRKERPDLSTIRRGVGSSAARANADMLAYATRANVQDTNPSIQRRATIQASRLKAYLAPFTRSLTALPRWEIREMIDELSANGRVNRNEIAADIGVDASLISRVVTQGTRGDSNEDPTEQKTTCMKDRISDVDLIARSLSTSRAELAQEFGYTEGTMRILIKTARRAIRSLDIDTSRVNRDELLALVKSHATLEEMAERLHADALTVARALIDQNMQRRRLSKPKEPKIRTPRVKKETLYKREPRAKKVKTVKPRETRVTIRQTTKPEAVSIEPVQEELEPEVLTVEVPESKPQVLPPPAFDIRVVHRSEVMDYVAGYLSEDEQILLDRILSEATAYPLREACARVVKLHKYPRTQPARLLRRVEGIVNSMS